MSSFPLQGNLLSDLLFDLFREFPRNPLLSYFSATLFFRGFLALWLTRHVTNININFLVWLGSGWPLDKQLVVPRLTGPKSLLCSPRDTGNINFSLWLTAEKNNKLSFCGPRWPVWDTFLTQNPPERVYEFASFPRK